MAVSHPLALLERACLITGLEAEGARLLRVGSNTVYRLTAPVIVRISRPGADVEHARRTVAVAGWLESVNYPAVRRKLSSIRPGSPVVPPNPGPPASSAGVMPRGSSSSASGFPAVSATIRSITF